MIPYRVFKQDAEGILHYDSSSQSLGEGYRELELIVDGHQLTSGAVVELNGQWLFFNGFDCEAPFVYMPAYEDRRFTFGDGHWSMQLKARLQHEATICEQMTEDSRSRRRGGA